MPDAQRPVLSIIVPAYNAEKTLRKCIDSLLDQGDAAIEVIVSDDGSTDNTWSVIREYMEKDPRVKGITSANGGASRARNRAIKIAQGRWITFADSDDYVKAGFLGQCIEVLEREDPDILDYQYSGDFSGAIYPATPSQVPKDVLLDREYLINMILPVLINVSDKREFFVNDYIWGKVFKAELIRQYNILFDETRRKMEDRLFIVMSMQYAQSYYSMSAYGYYYVGHSFGQTLSTTFDENVFHMVADSCRKYRQMYADLYDFDQPYTVRYYCELLIRMAVDQFGYDIEPEQREKMFRIFVEDATLMDLFSRYLPDERWKKEVCSAILRQDLQRLYPIFEKQYKKRRQREAVSRYINIFRRIISGIKRRLLKSR